MKNFNKTVPEWSEIEANGPDYLLKHRNPY